MAKSSKNYNFEVEKAKRRREKAQHEAAAMERSSAVQAIIAEKLRTSTRDKEKLIDRVLGADASSNVLRAELVRPSFVLDSEKPFSLSF